MSADSLIFQSRFTADKGYKRGTHRSVSPSVTLNRFEPLKAAMGITRLANITGLDRVGLPVVTAVTPNSRYVSVAHGKGITLNGAKVSALMEAAERFHAENPPNPVQFDRYSRIRKVERIVDLHTLPLLPGAEIDPDLETQWVSGHELYSGQQIWVPIEIVAHRPTKPSFPGTGMFRAGTNGLASGNEIIEATNHALYEVIERDARTLWSYSPKKWRASKRIDPESINDESCRSVLERIHRAELLVAIYDVTSDVGVATFVAHIIEANPRIRVPYARSQGGGTHPCREIALLRALTEALQTRLVMIEGAREDFYDHHYQVPEPHILEKSRTEIMNGPTPVNFRNVPTYDSDCLEGDLKWVMTNLLQAGLQQIIVVDLTIESLEIPVVRVVVPGLEDGDLTAAYVPGDRLLKTIGQHQ